MAGSFANSYTFTDKDPIIDQMRGVWESSGMDLKQTAAWTEIKYGTLTNWFYGSTRKPQYASVMRFMLAMGYRQQWIAPSKSKVVRLRRGT